MADGYTSTDGGANWRKVENFSRATSGAKMSRDKITARKENPRISVKIEESGTTDWGIASIVAHGELKGKLFDLA